MAEIEPAYTIISPVTCTEFRYVDLPYSNQFAMPDGYVNNVYNITVLLYAWMHRETCILFVTIDWRVIEMPSLLKSKCMIFHWGFWYPMVNWHNYTLSMSAAEWIFGKENNICRVWTVLWCLVKSLFNDSTLKYHSLCKVFPRKCVPMCPLL